jgi:hypothetical protein
MHVTSLKLGARHCPTSSFCCNVQVMCDTKSPRVTKSTGILDCHMHMAARTSNKDKTHQHSVQMRRPVHASVRCYFPYAPSSAQTMRSHSEESKKPVAVVSTHILPETTKARPATPDAHSFFQTAVECSLLLKLGR